MDNDFRAHLKRHLFWEGLLAIRAFLTRSTVFKPLLAAAGLLLVLAGINYGQKYRASAAESAFARATEVFHAEVGPLAPAGAGDSFKTPAEKFEKAKAMFDAAASSYSSFTAGKRAQYYSALCLLELGRTKEAEEALKQIAARRDPAAIEPAMARLWLADLVKDDGRAKEAAAYYRALIADEDSGLPKDRLIFGLATALEAAGEKLEARRTYTDLVNRHPQSPYVQEARQKMDALATL